MIFNSIVSNGGKHTLHTRISITPELEHLLKNVDGVCHCLLLNRYEFEFRIGFLFSQAEVYESILKLMRSEMEYRGIE